MTPLPGESILLRVYCSAGDTHLGAPLHEALVAAARAAGLAGASVMPGIMGYGRAGQIYSDVLAEYEAERQPLVVELVDGARRMETFLPTLWALVGERGLVTLERAEVVVYAAGAVEES